MRTITDDDIKAICDEMEKRLQRRFTVSVLEPAESTDELKEKARKRALETLETLGQLGILSKTFYSAKETAQLLNLTHRELIKMKQENKLPFPFYRKLDRTMYKKSEVDAYLAKK